jgi:hypothetical protein
MVRPPGGNHVVQDIGYPDPGGLRHGASCLCGAGRQGRLRPVTITTCAGAAPVFSN